MNTAYSSLNDAPNFSKYYASITEDVDLRAVGPGTPSANGEGFACWGFSVGGAGSLVLVGCDGANITFDADELNTKQIYPHQFTGVKLSGTTATKIRFYWRV